MDSEVLIVGAGPTGLALALWLTKLGVTVRIVDKTSGPGTTSRALAVHARTLELYRQLDLTDAIVSKGHKVPAINLWVKGAPQARVSLEGAGSGLTAYPFLHIFPQDEHEALLVERLEAFGVRVARETELLSFEQERDRIVARLRAPDGSEKTCEAAYIAGCDGAHSIVRETMQTGFPGGTYQQLFYVADVEASGRPVDGELHIDLDEADFLGVFPLAGVFSAAGVGRVRLVGSVKDEAAAARPGGLKFDDVNCRAMEHLKIHVDKVNWFSTYHVHHRVTEHFRKGRAFLLGDAGHIHSPVGGQGMNTGIGDAINLAWKLKWTLAGLAPDSLLDTFETERIPFARRLVNTTDRAFTLVTAEGEFAKLVRTHVAPLVLPPLAHTEIWRDFAFRAISQISINYRDCKLNAGKAGDVRGGDRLPWLAFDGQEDNYHGLDPTSWQLHVLAMTDADYQQWGAAQGVAVRFFPWRREYSKAGFVRGGAYLLRPDSYVALAAAPGSPQLLNRFFAERRMRPSPEARLGFTGVASHVA